MRFVFLNHEFNRYLYRDPMTQAFFKVWREGNEPLRSFYQWGMGGSIRWLNRSTFQEVRKGLFVSVEKNEGQDGDTEY